MGKIKVNTQMSLEVKQRIAELSATSGLKKQAIIEQAILLGLPAIEKRMAKR